MYLAGDRIKKSLHFLLRSQIIAFLFLSSTISAQSFYSTDPLYLKKRTEKKPFQYFYPDTTIEKAHQFIGRNFLGNIGLSNPQYVLKFKSRTLGFKLTDTPLEDYQIKKENIEYFQTKGPFAALSGIAGSKQLQLFRLMFTNTFKSKVNVAIRLNRYTSQGYYLRQQSFTNNFYTSGNYTTKKQRFGFNAYVLVNSNRFQENGGIVGDTLPQNYLTRPKELLPVKLGSSTPNDFASRNNSEFSAQYNNWFRLTEDSAKLNAFIGLRTAYSVLKYRYKDPHSGTNPFYHIFYVDTGSTDDSTRVRKFNNEINLTLRSKGNFNLELGYENEIAQVWQYSDTSFVNHMINVRMDNLYTIRSSDTSTVMKLNNSISGSYIAAGPFAGNYKAETFHQFTYARNKKTKAFLYLHLLSEERTPDYIFKRWYSNHFNWTNTFNNVQMNEAELSAKISFITLTGIYKGITNYLYFDQLAYPIQHAGTITNTAFRINLDKVFFKHLGIGAAQTWQYTGSNVISLPKSVSLASLFYRGNLFKNALQLAIGGQVEYYDQFNPYNYMPMTQVFYVQEKYKAGNFCFVDAFLNARIKPVTVFFKMENILPSLLGTNYSMVPGYYQPERAFRFGLTWLFFD
jgi:hypothetical protein